MGRPRRAPQRVIIVASSDARGCVGTRARDDRDDERYGMSFCVARWVIAREDKGEGEGRARRRAQRHVVVVCG